jgi:DNA methylase
MSGDTEATEFCESAALPKSTYLALATAALDPKPVSGWTHNFYRYPARFSPGFAAAAVAEFSRPGELVGDPYMGGGTAIVEAIAAGRSAIGNDLNALAAFVTRVKTTALTPAEITGIRSWAQVLVPTLNYRAAADKVAQFVDWEKARNLSLPRARFIKKLVASALASLATLPSMNAQAFVRCVVLRAGQWALDGRRRHTPLDDFRDKLLTLTEEMLEASMLLATQVRRSGGRAIVLNMDAAHLDQASVFHDEGRRLALVVTSPPYPGVHVLYHRWQVDGRRETPAPYWIAGCNDGQGASYYNFGDRRQGAADSYFQNSLLTLKAIRGIVKDGGHMIQLVAFNRPEEQLPRYLENLRVAGFAETRVRGRERIWREVPNRKWHATLLGQTHAAREVVLVHRAV